MISIALVVSLLLPRCASFAGPAQLRAPQDSVETQLPAAAPFEAPLVGRVTAAAAAAAVSLAPLPNVSTWRRLDEDMKLCGHVDFTTHIIKTKASDVRSAAAVDLDSDNDLDVLFHSYNDEKIAWHENLDGAGDFSGPLRVITVMRSHQWINLVLAADLDGDGDLDVLSNLANDGKITWYENLDGAGDFSGPLRVIINQADIVSTFAAADLDGDGDLDLLSAFFEDNKIAWYKNMDGTGEFWGRQPVITTQASSVRSVAAADLDNDGDLDVLSASANDDKIAWYENLGGGDFSGPQRIITTQADSARSVAAADLDNDGDLDVLSASTNDDKIVWYENLDGAGNFSGPQHVITNQADGSLSLAAADLDGDADLDVVSASIWDDKIAWYENLDGAGDFSQLQRVITTVAKGARTVVAADLNGDASLDILSASYSGVAWYENECLRTMPQTTYSQVSSKRTKTTGFERLCVAWSVIFGIISVVVLGYVVYASQHKDMKLARSVCTLVLSQYDYVSDTLLVGFQNFAKPTLFVAALISYLLPLAVFIVVYRRVVGAHLVHIYTSTKAKTIVRFDSWDEVSKALTEIGSFVLFPFALVASTLTYVVLLFVFVSCKLMSVSFLAVKFFETGGFECTLEAFEVMFKRNILSELVFESSGELIIVLVDASLRAQRDFQSITSLSSWALLSIVGSSLMLLIEAWPYLYHILLMGCGLEAGIAAVSPHLKFTPYEVMAPWLIDRLIRFAGLDASHGQRGDNHESSEIEIQIFQLKIIDPVEQPVE